MKSITVFVITYNQEDVIQRAIDSMLSQREWGLSQIIIGDDCSKDNTFSILLEYQKLYPEIVLPFRHEKNVGIYANLHSVVEKRRNTDLYLFCSGDDAFCAGFFESLQKFISKGNIPLDREIGIYSDWKAVSPDGKESMGNQDFSLVTKGYNLFSLHMRGLICNRGLAISKAVIDKYKPAVLNKGLHCAEGVYDSQASRYIEKAYYLNQITNVYYNGIGVSKTLSKTDYNTIDNIAKWEYFIENLIREKRDVYYAKYQICRSRFLMKPNCKYYLGAVYYFLRGLYPVTKQNMLNLIRIIINMPRNRI